MTEEEKRFLAGLPAYRGFGVLMKLLEEGKEHYMGLIESAAEEKDILRAVEKYRTWNEVIHYIRSAINTATEEMKEEQLWPVTKSY